MSLTKDKRHQEECSVKKEVRVRVMQLKAMEYQEPPEAGRGQERFSSRAFEGNMAMPTLLFQASGFQNSKNKFLLSYITAFVVI